MAAELKAPLGGLFLLRSRGLTAANGHQFLFFVAMASARPIQERQ